ncbi:Cyanocobalamin Reductase / Alkylcobalamin Dealkylase [Manis pentadactyla]|nr:Cyanocobalamin Reductase / Alkylcobalamin Dealkylase [Manis pentadactyla]
MVIHGDGYCLKSQFKKNVTLLRVFCRASHSSPDYCLETLPSEHLQNCTDFSLNLNRGPSINKTTVIDTCGWSYLDKKKETRVSWTTKTKNIQTNDRPEKNISKGLPK